MDTRRRGINSLSRGRAGFGRPKVPAKPFFVQGIRDQNIPIHYFGENGIYACRLPCLETLPSGRIVSFHEIRGSHVSDNYAYGIETQYSDDQGLTWSDPQILDIGASGVDNIAEPTGVYDPNTGKLWVFYVWRPFARNAPSKVFCRWSYDGATFYSPNQNSTLRAGLVAAYDFDQQMGDVIDWTERGNTLRGLAGGGTPTHAAGKIGASRSFSGNKTLINYGLPDFNCKSGKDWTISGWIYVTDNNTAQLIIGEGDPVSVGSSTYNGYERLFLTIGGGAPQLRAEGIMSDNNWYSVIASNVFTSTNTWYYIRVEYDDTLKSITISVNNGTPASTSFSPNTLREVASSTNRVVMGSRGAASHFFSGRMDEFKIWHRLLTADEKTEDYNSGNGWNRRQPTEITSSVKMSGSTIPGLVWPAESWGMLGTGPGRALVCSVGAHAGRIIVPAWHCLTNDTSGTANWHCFYSDDGGNTWNVGGGSDPGVNANDSANEGFIFERADGTLVWNGRMESGASSRMQATSTDGGLTWSNCSATGVPQNGVCQGNFVQLAPGDVLWTQPTGGIYRRRLGLYRTQDGGINWSLVGYISLRSGAYSALTKVKDTIVCHYETGQTNSNGLAQPWWQIVQQARFNVAALKKWPTHYFELSFDDLRLNEVVVTADGTSVAQGRGCGLYDTGPWQCHAAANYAHTTINATSPIQKADGIYATAADAIRLTPLTTSSGDILRYDGAMSFPATQDFTIQLRVSRFMTDAGTTNQTFLLRNNGTDQFYLRINGSRKPEFYAANGANSVTVSGTGLPDWLSMYGSDPAFDNYAVVRSGRNYKFYFNGNLIGETTVAFDLDFTVDNTATLLNSGTAVPVTYQRMRVDWKALTAAELWGADTATRVAPAVIKFAETADEPLAAHSNTTLWLASPKRLARTGGLYADNGNICAIKDVPWKNFAHQPRHARLFNKTNSVTNGFCRYFGTGSLQNTRLGYASGIGWSYWCVSDQLPVGMSTNGTDHRGIFDYIPTSRVFTFFTAFYCTWDTFGLLFRQSDGLSANPGLSVYRRTGGDISVAIGTGSGYALNATLDLNTAINTPYFFAITGDGSNALYYIAQLSASSLTSGSAGSFTSPGTYSANNNWMLGGTNVGYIFQGGIREIAVLNDTLSSGQLLTQFNRIKTEIAAESLNT